MLSMEKVLKFDFDIHPKNGYMYFWIKDYMIATYKAASRTGFNFKNKTIYDVGVGRGRTFSIYKKLGIEKVLGFDVDKGETKFAKAQAKKLKLDLKLILDSEDNKKLQKVPSNSCELVALMNILFCLPNNQSRMRIIKEVKRILKKGGLLVVMDMQKPSLMSLVSFLAFKNWKFRSHTELLKMMKPLRLISYETSNHFYFVNFFADILGKIFGPNIFEHLNDLFRYLHVPASTKTFIFTKK